MRGVELMRVTVGELLERNGEAWPAREACVFGPSGPRWSWGALHDRVVEVARGLMSLGVRSGDHVAVWGTNRPEWLLTQLGAAMIGAPLVTINPEWKVQELEFALEASDTRVLVLFPGFEKVSGAKRHRYDYPGALRQLVPDLDRFDEGPIFSEKLPRLEHAVLVEQPAPAGFLSWKRMLERGSFVSRRDLERRSARVSSDDVVLIQYTSGTTGFPKGAMLTHHGVTNNARAGAANLGLTEEDRICITVPYYHCFGSIVANLGAVVSGATMVVPSEHFDAHRALEAIERERCTVLHGVPSMFISELEDADFDAHDLSTLRTGVMAGAPCPVELMRDVMERMGLRGITIGYGLTEASPLTHQTLPSDPIDKRVQTVGVPIPHTEARVVDPTTLEELPRGEVGEVWVRGYHVMRGYYGRPEETAESIRDGWLRTGDLAQIDDDGYYRIVGRLKEMIIVGGHNVYPAEVEQSILSLFEDRIDVVQVVGLPHPKLQEVVAAVIHKKQGASVGEEEIRLRCMEKMEWPKVPRHILFVDDFTGLMTATGKIQKFKLRELTQRMLPV